MSAYRTGNVTRADAAVGSRIKPLAVHLRGLNDSPRRIRHLFVLMPSTALRVS